MQQIKKYWISITILFLMLIIHLEVIKRNDKIFDSFTLMILFFWIILSLFVHYTIRNKLTKNRFNLNKLRLKNINKLNIEKYQVPMMVLEIKNDYYICVNANERLSSFLGCKKKKVIGKTLIELFPNDKQLFLSPKIERIIKEKKTLHFETILPTSSSIKIVNVSFLLKSQFMIVSFEELKNVDKESNNKADLSQRLNMALSLAKNITVLEINLDENRVWASDFFFDLFEIDKTKDGIISLDVFKKIFFSREHIIINDRYQTLDDLFSHTINRLKCILPTQNIVYADYNVIQVNEHLIYLSIIDMTKKVLENKMLKDQLRFDSLTGLISRDLYKEEIKALIDKKPNNYGALYFLDIDDFKNINDTYGHIFGDKIIKQFSQILKALLEDFYHEEIDYVISRIAGDEIVFYVHDLSLENKHIQSIKNIIKNTKLNIYVDYINVKLSISVGISIYNKDTRNIDDLVEYGDFAMYCAKRKGKAQVNLFEYKAFILENKFKEISVNLDKIIEERQFYHVYQPIVDIKNVEIIAYEALSRPDDQLNISILHLLDIASRNNKHKKLECILYLSILEDFLNKGNLDKYVFINEGPYDIFEGYEEGRDIAIELIRQGIKYVVEITEQSSIESEYIEKKIELIKNTGGLVALDDFGAGYSNDIALLSMEPEFIKIDRALIQGIENDKRKKILVSNIVRYADNQITVIAEGVETYDELKTVIELGIDCVQGYYICKPNKDLLELSDDVKQEIIKIKAGKAS